MHCTCFQLSWLVSFGAFVCPCQGRLHGRACRPEHLHSPCSSCCQGCSSAPALPGAWGVELCWGEV